MASMQVQRNFRRDEGGKTTDGELTRCPHCSQHFYSGGEVDQEAHGFEADREEEDDFMGKVDEYSARHHGRSAEGGKYVGYADGGKVKPPRSSEQYSRDDDDGYVRASARGMRRDHEGDAAQDFARENYPEDDKGSEVAQREQYAEGGRVDGAGKVDGVHLHPSECSHLAAGGVCRHMPGRARGGDNAGDSAPRNFSDGGGVSFEGYLAKRRAGRGGRKG